MWGFFPISILLDEEGHIKITGQCIQLQTIFCFSLFTFYLMLIFLLILSTLPSVSLSQTSG